MDLLCGNRKHRNREGRNNTKKTTENDKCSGTGLTGTMQICISGFYGISQNKYLGLLRLSILTSLVKTGEFLILGELIPFYLFRNDWNKS